MAKLTIPPYYPYGVNGNGDGLSGYPDMAMVWAHINASKIAVIDNRVGELLFKHNGVDMDLEMYDGDGWTPYSKPVGLIFDIYPDQASIFISPVDAYNVDAKIYDGLPTTGNLIAGKWSSFSGSCMVASDGTTEILDFDDSQDTSGSSYNKSYSGLGCSDILYEISIN